MLGLGLSIPQVAVRGGVDPIAELFARLGGVGTWVDPRMGSTVYADTAGTTPATVGGTVARIDASGGVAASFTNATAAQRPILRADGLELDGVDDRLVYPDDPALRFGTTDFTIAFAVRPSDITKNGHFFDKRGTGQSDPIRKGWGLTHYGRALRLFMDNGTTLFSPYLTGDVFNNGVPQYGLVELDRTAGTATARVGGVDFSPVAISAGDISGTIPLVIGNSANGYVFPFGGLTGRLLAIDKRLSAQDKATVEQWLQAGFA